ncbi:hypothetical protein [Sorangium sp. So ce131]
MNDLSPDDLDALLAMADAVLAEPERTLSAPAPPSCPACCSR